MKQNIKNKILRTIKISFLLGFLIVEFFGFKFIPTAFATGSITLTISGPHTFDQLPYQQNESFDVNISINGVSGSTSAGVNIVTSVNGTVVGSFTQQNQNLSAAQTQKGVQVTTGNGFVNGANTVNVSVYDVAVQGSALASGSAIIQAAGLTASSTTAPVNTQPSPTQSVAATPATTPTINCTQNPNSCLINPLPENDLTHVFLLVTKSFLDIMGIWAVMFIIFGGFQMVLSSGNEEAYAKAKKTITWAVLGLAVAILSFSIVAIVEDLLQANIQAPTTTPTSATTIPTTNNATGNFPINTTNPPNNSTGNFPN
jgi:hypothetical protein